MVAMAMNSGSGDNTPNAHDDLQPRVVGNAVEELQWDNMRQTMLSGTPLRRGGYGMKMSVVIGCALTGNPPSSSARPRCHLSETGTASRFTFLAGVITKRFTLTLEDSGRDNVHVHIAGMARNPATGMVDGF